MIRGQRSYTNQILWSRRNTLLVLIDILSCIAQKGGTAKKTEVAQCSNLNTNVFNRYLSLLEAVGAISLKREGRNIKLTLTHQGIALLTLLRYLASILNPNENVARAVRIGHLIESIAFPGVSPPIDDSPMIITQCLYFVCISSNGFCCISRGESNDHLLRCCRVDGNVVTCNTIEIKVSDLEDTLPETLIGYIKHLCI